MTWPNELSDERARGLVSCIVLSGGSIASRHLSDDDMTLAETLEEVDILKSAGTGLRKIFTLNAERAGFSPEEVLDLWDRTGLQPLVLMGKFDSEKCAAVAGPGITNLHIALRSDHPVTVDAVMRRAGASQGACRVLLDRSVSRIIPEDGADGRRSIAKRWKDRRASLKVAGRHDYVALATLPPGQIFSSYAVGSGGAAFEMEVDVKGETVEATHMVPVSQPAHTYLSSYAQSLWRRSRPLDPWFGSFSQTLHIVRALSFAGLAVGIVILALSANVSEFVASVVLGLSISGVFATHQK